jgi:hypothetical protein
LTASAAFAASLLACFAAANAKAPASVLAASPAALIVNDRFGLLAPSALFSFPFFVVGTRFGFTTSLRSRAVKAPDLEGVNVSQYLSTSVNDRQVLPSGLTKYLSVCPAVLPCCLVRIC